MCTHCLSHSSPISCHTTRSFHPLMVVRYIYVYMSPDASFFNFWSVLFVNSGGQDVPPCSGGHPQGAGKSHTYRIFPPYATLPFDRPRDTPIILYSHSLPTMTPTPFFSHISTVFYVFYFCVYVVLAARRLCFPYCCFPLVHVSCSSPRRPFLFTLFCTFSLQLSEKIAACVRESAALKEKQVSEFF